MAESLFNSMLLTLDRGATSQIAQKLGEPDAAVSRGLETSIASVLAGAANKSDDPGSLRRILEMAPGISGRWSSLVGDFTNPGSTVLASGRRILAGLFGNKESALTSAISHEAGLGAGSASTILGMAAPMVMSFLGKKIRDGDMTMSGLCSSLAGESGALRRALPPAASDIIWRRTEEPVESPVVAQSVQRVSSAPWAAVLALCALALGGLWLLTHRGRHIEYTPTGTANRVAGEANRAANAVRERMPRLDLKLPDATGESTLMKFVQDKNAVPSPNTSFIFERLRFSTGSAKLRPEASAQLDDIATIFKAYPGLHANVVGHTDSQGSAPANHALSEARANTVKSELEARGISDSRLTAQGMGEDNAIADNATDAGRAENRRVDVQVTQK